ncbi:hypothetical protein DVH24_003217 [Malus domestica]|uniref:Uncharacterized protein n=1 Tax=Malus domestica TaxID=3750 RepID=A0A498IHY4_MALDO|nr:hypothetical protein DVH24_003217 [Malus domestica]
MLNDYNVRWEVSKDMLTPLPDPFNPYRPCTSIHPWNHDLGFKFSISVFTKEVLVCYKLSLHLTGVSLALSPSTSDMVWSLKSKSYGSCTKHMYSLLLLSKEKLPLGYVHYQSTQAEQRLVEGCASSR